LAEADRRESAMKSVVPLILVAGICTANASAQSSLFDKYDVKMTGWAQLPAGRQWEARPPGLPPMARGKSSFSCVRHPISRFLRQKENSCDRRVTRACSTRHTVPISTATETFGRPIRMTMSSTNLARTEKC
jgi:hypothetical protein